jgi:cell division protein FtsI/penicillin-binding protein 2
MPMANSSGVNMRCDRVALWTVVGMTALMLVMLVRVAQLQLSPGPRLAAHVQERVTKRSVAAPRGDIVDRAGRFLATSEFGYRLFVDPTVFPDPPHEAIAKLSSVLGDDAGVVGERIISRMMINQERLGVSPARALAMESGNASLPAMQRLSLMVQRAKAPAAVQMAGTGEEEHQDRGADLGGAMKDGTAKKPIRYVRISDVLDDATIAAVRDLKIPGVHLEQRSVRQYPSEGLAASIVGKVGAEEMGLLGAERMHDADLTGASGRILYVRDAGGRPLWMGPDSFELPKRGQDLRLSIDLELQRIATNELQRGVEECDAAGGRLVMMDPATGEIVAMVDIVREVPEAVEFPWPDARPPAEQRSRGLLYEPPPAVPRGRYRVVNADPKRLEHPALGRNRCVEDIYEPGSTFKTFVWATVTELDKYKLNEVLQTGNGYWRTPYGRLIHDVHGKPSQTWAEVLVNSSNIGMSQGAERLTHDQLHAAVRRFGFGSRTGIGLPGESPGRVTPRKLWNKYTQTSVSFGQEIAVTPVQMVRAFCAYARAGEMGGTLPKARLKALDEDDPDAFVAHRVLRPEVAAEVRRLLANVAAQMEDKMAIMKKESGWRYSMFGKSGTAQIPLGAPPAGKRRPPGKGYYERQYNSSFIGAGPTEDPRLVILVIIDDPGPDLVRRNVYYGSLTAGPVARRVMEKSLAYLGVPPSPVAKRASGGVGWSGAD